MDGFDSEGDVTDLLAGLTAFACALPVYPLIWWLVWDYETNEDGW